MNKRNINSVLSSELLNFLVKSSSSKDGRIPPLTKLSEELGLSVASIREQLEVARALGFVEVKTKTGIRMLPYSFVPAVKQSLAYSISLQPENFKKYYDLRRHIETSYWDVAVSLLTKEDMDILSLLIIRAFEKLNNQPIQIPHKEHRDLHMTIFRRLDNPYVYGLLEAYWDLYEIVGLDMYTDIKYLKEVWDSHRDLVNSIVQNDFETGHKILNNNLDLLQRRSNYSVS